MAEKQVIINGKIFFNNRLAGFFFFYFIRVLLNRKLYLSMRLVNFSHELFLTIVFFLANLVSVYRGHLRDVRKIACFWGKCFLLKIFRTGCDFFCSKFFARVANFSRAICFFCKIFAWGAVAHASPEA